jgi:hypothetical protein
MDKRQNLYMNLGAVKSTPITGGAQTLDPTGRGVHVTGDGNIIGKLIEDTADRTFSGLIAGSVYPYCFKSITSATATGLILH